jgi:hypothetical protein
MSWREKVWKCFEDKDVILKWNVQTELPTPPRMPRCTERSGLLSPVVNASLPVRGRYAGKVRVLVTLPAAVGIFDVSGERLHPLRAKGKVTV